MNNKTLLVLIAVILTGILAFVAIDATQQSPSEQVAEDIGNISDTISDEIEGN